MSSSTLPEVLLGFPVKAPPKGYTSNFQNPQSDGRILTSINSVFLVFQILFFSIRIYVKAFIKRKMTWDDLTCAIGFALATGFYALCIYGVNNCYVGVHGWDVTIGQLLRSNFKPVQLSLQALGALSLGSIKLTYFLFYWPIFCPLKWARIAIWIGAVTNTVFYLALCILQLVYAVPRPGENIVTHATGKLYKHALALQVPLGALSVVFDLYILILPLWGVWTLNLNLRQKFGVSVIFLTGIMACVCSMISLYYRIMLNRSKDLLRDQVPLLTVSLAEMQIGIVCCCMPALSFLIKNVRRKSQNDSESTYPSTFESNKISSGGRQDRYITVEESATLREPSIDGLELATGKPGVRSTIETRIGNGQRPNISHEESAIHLTFDVQQQREPSQQVEKIHSKY